MSQINKYLKCFQLIPLLVFLLFAAQNTHGQKSVNNLISKAKKHRTRLDYSKSIKAYKAALVLAPENKKALEGLIEIYLYQYEIYDSAQVYIERRMNSMQSDTNFGIFFDYGNCLRMQEKPNEAIEQYEFFKKRGLYRNKYAYLEEEVETYIKACQAAIKNQNSTSGNTVYTVENMDFFINSVDSEYTPVFIEQDSLLLYNARYKDFEYEEVTDDNKYYENIYYFDLKESVASSYNPGIKQDNHHAVVGHGYKSDTILIFHRNKLWISAIEQDRLNQFSPLPEKLSDFYFQPHGIFTDNGNTFIFSAMEVPEEFGGDLDIYVSYKVDTIWSEPRPISPLINSRYDEDSPYLSKDGKTLYFSSKGHNSSGGYDFYKSELIDGEWSEPQNLGYPMNSAGDDIYLSLTDDEKSGFFSSNRAGGFGGMDIYRFEINERSTQGSIINKSGHSPTSTLSNGTEDRAAFNAGILLGGLKSSLLNNVSVREELASKTTTIDNYTLINKNLGGLISFGFNTHYCNLVILSTQAIRRNNPSTDLINNNNRLDKMSWI